MAVVGKYAAPCENSKTAKRSGDVVASHSKNLFRGAEHKNLIRSIQNNKPVPSFPTNHISTNDLCSLNKSQTKVNWSTRVYIVSSAAIEFYKHMILPNSNYSSIFLIPLLQNVDKPLHLWTCGHVNMIRLYCHFL